MDSIFLIELKLMFLRGSVMTDTKDISKESFLNNAEESFLQKYAGDKHASVALTILAAIKSSEFNSVKNTKDYTKDTPEYWVEVYVTLVYMHNLFAQRVEKPEEYASMCLKYNIDSYKILQWILLISRLKDFIDIDYIMMYGLDRDVEKIITEAALLNG
jgi:hypothetical protein